MAERFDYIVVGGGSAGCVTAARLVRDHGARVLLLEAGGRDNSPLFRMPAGFIKFLKGSRHLRFNESVAQSQLGGRKPVIPTAKVLGGGSTVNAMVYMRGQPSDFEAWQEASGYEGNWDFPHLAPYFKRMERNEHLNNEMHGVDGPLAVSGHTHRVPVSHAFVSALQGYGVRFNPDFNGGDPYGVGYIQLTKDGIRRCSAVDAFLRPVIENPRLTVRTNCLVQKLEIENGRAIGVTYFQQGKRHQAFSEAEIIVCAGTFETPKLLMLSGIGDSRHLESHGIKVVSNLPGVGQNLHDHPEVGVVSSTKRRVGYMNEDVGFKMVLNGLQYVIFGSGPVASNGVEACAFLSPNGDTARPSIQLFCVPSVYLDADVKDVKPTDGLTLISCLVKPKSRGSVTLKSSDHRDAPLIDPAYLSASEDLTSAVEAIKISREILLTEPLLGLVQEELLPGKMTMTDDDIAAYCRRTVKTGYHPVGTCRMGRDSDPMAVVNSNLQVKGIDNLRVFDASMMPVVTSSNTNATVMAVADKAVAMMMGEMPLEPIALK